MIYRSVAEDFRVEEVPLCLPSGQGSHWYLLVEKRELDSTEVVRALAETGGFEPQQVGMAGRKDRHAVTRQWFSVPVAAHAREPELNLPGAEVLAVSRHAHKLRTGQLLGNRFSLIVREVRKADQEGIESRFAAVEASGFANRFGAQRFGRNRDNADKGRDILLGGKLPRDRRAAHFFVSALQSQLFNHCLRLRRQELGLETLVDGDLAFTHASGSVFWIDSADREQHRVRSGELSATGPMFGDKMRRPFGNAGRWENQALMDNDLDMAQLGSRRGLRLYGARRSVRALPDEMSLAFDGEIARITVCLAAGCYASVFLEEVCGQDLMEAERQRGGQTLDDLPTHRLET